MQGSGYSAHEEREGKNLKRLEGKTALITGGASGIGEACVRLFIEEGARVVIADILDVDGRRLAEEFGESALFVHTDVVRESDIEAAVNQAVENYGRLDCIINNAGTDGVYGRIEDLSLEKYDQAMAVLLRGVVLGMKHAARVMKPHGSGSIISTSSVAGIITGMGDHTYSAAKAAINQLTRSVATELGLSGVRVNCICPGVTATPIFSKVMRMSPEQANQAPEIIKAAFTDFQPIRRTGLPEDIAQAAVWLASDESSFVTGHSLVVDGGLSIGRSLSEYYNKARSAFGLKAITDMY